VDAHIHQTSRKSLNKRCLSARKMTATILEGGGGSNGVLMIEFAQQGTIIKSEMYCETLKNCVGPAIQNQRRGMLTYSILLLHDNARPYTFARTRLLPVHFNWVLFDHPPYSRDFAPSDYHLFTYQNKLIGGRLF
jgi:hypothetical protein